MKLHIQGWNEGAPIPNKFAFGKIPTEGRFELAENINPAIFWTDIPKGTKSFALICHDSDVPSSGENVNIEGKTISPDLPRVDFYHWVVANIPSSTTKIDEGQASNRVTPTGKKPGARPYGEAGLNNYTNWFADHPTMGGNYADYDGPCPPWNDALIHHYHFTIYALDVNEVSLPQPFGGPELLTAIDGHVLAKACYTGTYSMNRDL
ncbi:YbhB/YbcL family Raf kinase inhibitor-like protein [Thalassospira lucentensis]|uniref:YbhB/YbcL family Raf kinase inhibitor-like protein n=1 Tax=Thalassospira lucentensis TaxID=168935 RepID=UPI003D2EABB2